VLRGGGCLAAGVAKMSRYVLYLDRKHEVTEPVTNGRCVYSITALGIG